MTDIPDQQKICVCRINGISNGLPIVQGTEMPSCLGSRNLVRTKNLYLEILEILHAKAGISPPFTVWKHFSYSAI